MYENTAIKGRGCYSVADVEKILEISRQSVYRLIKRNLFDAVRLNNKYRIKKESFDNWLEGTK